MIVIVKEGDTMRLRLVGGWVVATCIITMGCDVTDPSVAGGGAVEFVEGTPLTMGSSISPRSHIGTHIGDFPDFDLDDAAAYLDTAGVEWIRITLPWHVIETSPGQYSWNMGRENVIKGVNQAGYRILLVIEGTPEWARDDQSCEQYIQSVSSPHVNGPLWKCPPEPEYYDDFQAFVEAASTHYPFVEAWEVWNETFTESSQLGVRGRGFFYGTPEEEDSLVNRAAAAIGGQSQVVCCGYGPPEPGEPDRDFISQQAARLASAGLTAISLHQYDTLRGAEVVDHVQDVLGDLSTAGVNLPIWVTEFGAGNPHVHDASQYEPADRRDVIDSVLTQTEAEPDWIRSFYFHFNRECNPVVEPCRNVAYSDRGDQIDSLESAPFCAMVRAAGNQGNGTCAFDVDVLGQTTIFSEGLQTYHLATENDFGDRVFWSFLWEYRPAGGSWQAVGSDSTYSRFVGSSHPDFELRATVDAWNGGTGGASRSAQDADSISVTVSVIGGGCPPPQIQCE